MLEGERVYRPSPRGLMLIPLFVGALIRTLLPRTFTDHNAVVEKSFTGGFLTGAMPFLGLLRMPRLHD